MTHSISLLPLDASLHADALQRVYELSPAYWAMYHLAQAPAGQAARDLAAIADEPGRIGLGIAAANEPGNADAGAQLVGMIDLRLQWPDPDMAYIGILLVAEPFQRQRVGSDAWALLEPWLAGDAGQRAVKLGVEQFNPGALRFFQSLGFSLTGEAQRIRSGKRLVRLLAMEKELKSEG
ncbi:MAG: GNAT family N-acetyltransferase [Caldilineaceae bacterium]|nr:GNAT family N-acetyltransferase [Caldilineaceae bacterium]MCY4117396.1 GNAT family N-acetyltransferase [Caldilineaceae bacterium]